MLFFYVFFFLCCMFKYVKYCVKFVRGSFVLVVIVCDEVVCIECCLMSVKLYVDCMIVLDIGLIDDIVVIVKVCGV